MKGLHLDIVSPEKEIFTGEVDSVTLPGTLGSFTILVQHAPIVSSLKAGTLDIHGGFVEMNSNRVSVCID